MKIIFFNCIWERQRQTESGKGSLKRETEKEIETDRERKRKLKDRHREKSKGEGKAESRTINSPNIGRSAEHLLWQLGRERERESEQCAGQANIKGVNGNYLITFELSRNLNSVPR